MDGEDPEEGELTAEEQIEIAQEVDLILAGMASSPAAPQ